MKKKLIILLLLVALLPVRVFAAGVTEYKENDKQAVIYMFRGQGCGYCRAFLTFLSSITEEYGEYFKLVSFEVWNDTTNSELFTKVATFKGEDLSNLGVPYILIGDKVFAGYASSYDDQIKDAIMAQYKDSSYDVMKKAGVKVSDYKTMNFIETLEAEDLIEENNGEKEKTSSDSGSSSFAVVFWNAFFVVAGAVAIIVVNNKNTERVLAAMNKKEPKEIKKK